MTKTNSRIPLWVSSALAGLCLAYSFACHWLGFLSESKVNRLSMLLVFGGLLTFLVYLFIRWAIPCLTADLSRRFGLLIAGVALTIALAAIALMTIRFPETWLVNAQASSRLWVVGLFMADFMDLAGLIFSLGLILASALMHRKALIGAAPRLARVLFPLPLFFLLTIILNLVVATNDRSSAMNTLARMPSNDLIGLDEGSRTFKENIRVDAVFFTHYMGWRLIAPKELVASLRLDRDQTLIRWGRIASIRYASYPGSLSPAEMEALFAEPYVNVENGSGKRFIAVLADDPNHQVCLRVNGDFIFIVPVILSPVCVSQ
jgi:hypothetical protein